ncbi:MAG: hypothetical protein JJT89_13625, partial [Nitriliruptoraceae bacterium]|nr:hypothetical protein [Nitriliruptoraceae bacterium]
AGSAGGDGGTVQRDTGGARAGRGPASGAKSPAVADPTSTSPYGIPNPAAGGSSPSSVAPDAPSAPSRSTDQQPDEQRTNRALLWFGAAAAALVAVVVVLVVVGTGPSATSPEVAEPDPPPTTAPPDGGSLFDQPSVPQDVALDADADGIEITWAADPVASATYVVSVTAGPLEGRTEAVEEPRLQLPGGAEERICVRVLAVVGSTSSEPSREECT